MSNPIRRLLGFRPTPPKAQPPEVRHVPVMYVVAKVETCMSGSCGWWPRSLADHGTRTGVYHTLRAGPYRAEAIELSSLGGFVVYFHHLDDDAPHQMEEVDTLFAAKELFRRVVLAEVSDFVEVAIETRHA